MPDVFNSETFRSNVQSVLNAKSQLSADEYTRQLEQLLGNIPLQDTPPADPRINELLDLLSKTRSRINSLFYNAPIGYCVLNPNGKIATANNAFCSLFDLDQSTIDGTDLKDFILPESLDLYTFQLNKVLTSKATLSTNLRFFQGARQIFIRFQATYYSEDGNDYLQCIATDISDTKAIENELELSEMQFRNLLEASPVGILVIHKGKYIYSNKAGAEIFGYDNPDDLVDLDVMNTVADESKAVIRERIQRLEDNIRNTPLEGTILCKDGTKKICESVSIPVIFNNRLSGLIMLSDISARKAGEKGKRESENKYEEMYQLLRVMCDNVPDMIWAKNLSNEYIFANKAVCEIMLNAIDTEEPIGKTDAYFADREREQHAGNPDWYTFGELCRKSDDIVLESLQNQRFDECGNIKGEFICLDVFKSPFYDISGKLAGTIGSGRNNTRERWLQAEHQKTLEALTNQTNRLNAVINVIPDLLFILNTKGEFLDFFASDPQKLAFSPDQIKALTLKNLFPPAEVERQLEIFKKCIETNQILTFEYTITVNDSLLDYETRTAPLGKDTVLAITRDITEKKLTDTQLKKYTAELILAKENAEKSDQLKSAFLANMSHEIRTPMNSIMGFADLLTDPYLEVEKRQEFSNIIISRSIDLLQIIDDVLDFSRIESGNATLHNSNCDLNNLLDQLYLTYNTKLRMSAASEVRLICEKAVSSGHLAFEIDEIKLKQVFANLLDNALKFTEKGSIKFGFRMPDNGTITCFVSDTGIGIDPKYTEIIFERFRQAEIPDRNKYKGTGLGLAISKGNIELMGGRIWVETEAGKGSKFIFELPFVQLQPSADKTSTHQVISGFNWQGKTALLVEDDAQNVTYIETILRKTGITVKVAADGNAMREILENTPEIHIILMDIQLPGEDGWQLTQYVKSIRSDIPVIAQTAYGLESDRQQSMVSGCDNYIVKPILPDELLKMMAPYLEK